MKTKVKHETASRRRVHGEGEAEVVTATLEHEHELLAELDTTQREHEEARTAFQQVDHALSVLRGNTSMRLDGSRRLIVVDGLEVDVDELGSLERAALTTELEGRAGEVAKRYRLATERRAAARKRVAAAELPSQHARHERASERLVQARGEIEREMGILLAKAIELGEALADERRSAERANAVAIDAAASEAERRRLKENARLRQVVTRIDEKGGVDVKPRVDRDLFRRDDPRDATTWDEYGRLLRLAVAEPKRAAQLARGEHEPLARAAGIANTRRR